MLVGCLTRLKHLTCQCVQALRTRLVAWTKPASASLAGGMVVLTMLVVLLALGALLVTSGNTARR